MNTLYPPAPVAVDIQLLTPSAAFKKEVSKVVVQIILFFVVYLLLVIAAVALAIGCIYGGIALMANLRGLWVYLFGIGLMAFGLAIVFFLVKFLFAAHKQEDNGSIEITEAQHPILFEFIRKLTVETQTPFPKKIFLIPIVNASVSYKVSFWSMFFPVRKNLEIGVGLVNVLNAGEFKAIMAHEFGHFSQRSLRLGSYIYYVNNIIYNMLFENKGYGGFLNSWGNLHGIFQLFTVAVAKIAEGIQWILRKMYAPVNKAYMGLSREMEFHADAIAASVAGGNNLVSALDKILIAHSCYEEAMTRATDSLSDNKATANLFADQRVVLNLIGKGFSLNAELPSRVNYQDQWASHPTTEERTGRLHQLNWNVAPVADPAWGFFNDPEQVQLNMTRHMYAHSGVTETLSFYDKEEFEHNFIKDREAISLPLKYRTWFSARYPGQEVVKQLAGLPVFPLAWNDIVNETNQNLPTLLRANERDMMIVEAIAHGKIDVKSFDFDGQKYDVSEAPAVVEDLRSEIERLHQQMQETDLKILQYLKQQAPEGGHDFITRSARQGQFNDVSKEILTLIMPFFSHQPLSAEEVSLTVEKLKAGPEPACLTLWREMLDNKGFQGNEPLHKAVESFVNSYHFYWNGKNFNEKDIEDLYNLVVETDNWMAHFVFLAFRQWLEQVPA
ncbi:M48 family metallopeptidase [Filimonas effusa]|uniref:Peptidase M48 domain-containing protein n=1 Tax=Filimonas effusa TaxID=2508721 RepID=A0A4Q1D7H3_9BACT|nr:M48 family metallopeptidase [Filimonas effusa]RXK83701.1 hypothetical protein ESB13_16610 [Filimonas effusa]